MVAPFLGGALVGGGPSRCQRIAYTQQWPMLPSPHCLLVYQSWPRKKITSKHKIKGRFGASLFSSSLLHVNQGARVEYN